MKPLHWFILLAVVLLIIGGTVTYKNIQSKNPAKWTDKYNDLFIKYGTLNGVRPELLKAIAMQESTLGKNKGLELKGGTTGLMQIKLSTAQDFEKKLTAEELFTDEAQVRCAAKYLSSLLKLFKGDEQKAILSYNQGQGNTLKGKTYAAPYLADIQNHLTELGVA